MLDRLKRLHLLTVIIAVTGIHFALAEPLNFTGMCDASAAVAIDSRRFIVANDEDNVLRVYSRGGGAPLSEFDVSEFLGVQGKKKAKETDLEAAAQVGGRIFWITSHGRNARGQDKPERQRLFMTQLQVTGDKVKITPVGAPYSALLDDLIRNKELAPYCLDQAARLAPKAEGGLNIEGLAATPEGHLLIGFRNPVPKGKALLVPLLNPREVCKGIAAKFGPPMELDLEGLGIRSIEFFAGRYVIVAGSTGEGATASRLFEWDGNAQPKRIPNVTLRGLNAEGVAFPGVEGAKEFFVFSDDGTREINGQSCKDLKDPSKKTFRAQIFKF